jgi:uncharacterized membrane protein
MSTTAISRSRVLEGPRGRSDARSVPERLALPVILVVAAVNFFWQLGSSSYFTDEAFSVMHSLPALHALFGLIAHTETVPYTYFLFLHEWISRTGSQAEWVTRVPSAVAGVVLVASVYWMARAFVQRHVALGAAALCAISPLIQSYAQETRAYIFFVVAVTIAVGATVRGCQRTENQTAFLTLGALSLFLSMWIHYIAVGVILPLAVWVATRSSLSRRQRGIFVAVSIAAVGSVLPLLLEQYSIFPAGGAILGQTNLRNTISVVGTPFGTRVGTPIDARTVAAALLVLFSLAVLLVFRRRPVRERGLLVALGVVGVLGLFVVNLFADKHILITRYTVETAPFLVTGIAAACAQLPRAAAGTLAAGTLAVSAAGLVDNHSRSGFWPPVKQAIEYIAPRERPGDFLLSPGFPLTDIPIFYYVTHTPLIRPKIHVFGLAPLSLRTPGVRDAFRRYKRLWIIDHPRSATPAAAVRAVRPLLARYHRRAVDVRAYSTSINLGVMLAVPKNGH